MADALVVGYTGYTIGDLVNLFAGDMYLFSDLVEQEQPAEEQLGSPGGAAGAGPGAGPGAGGRSADRFAGRNLVALGIVDFQATAQALAKLHEVALADPNLAQMVGRTEYQGRTLYLIGPRAPGTDGDIQLEHAAVVALLDAHLAVGGFDEVTRLIRGGGEGGPGGDMDVPAALKAHRGSSFLVVLTKGLLDRFDRFRQQSQGEPTAEDLIEGLRELELPLDGDPAEQDLRDALIRLLRLSDSFSARLNTFPGPALTVHGRSVESAYRLVVESTLRRP